MFDGSTETFEALKRCGTIQIIPTMGDKILLAREQQPLTEERMTFFGGRQEDGEKPLETAKRELMEEAGLESDDWELLQTHEPSGKIDWKIYVFVARNCRKVAEQNLDAGEKISTLEVDFDGFVEKVTSDDFWNRESSNHLYRLKHEGKLDEYKQILFGKK